MASSVAAGPTKRFFVRMLTRDIDLDDAILDLLDNCVDGILRDLRGKKLKGAQPYRGYKAKLTATTDRFEIEDNCGGIPRSVAINSAFMLGRPDSDRDDDLETVGMYGIGMKRAIFKMGRRATVASRHRNSRYKVEIPPVWLDDETNWKLNLEDTPRAKMTAGTRIRVTELYDHIAECFDEDNNSFVETLRKKVSQLFAIIIEKGFEVTVNDVRVEPLELNLFAPEKSDFDDLSLIPPYVFDARIDDITVLVAVGFYRPLATETELRNEKRMARVRSDAGWTVICNDRVVLHADTSAVTGWGQSNVPRFHNQFISIAGVVVFRGKHAWKLPLNTTKRGLDTSSEIYLFVKNYMMEGMKKFTDFTNWWKTMEAGTTSAFDKMEKIKPEQLKSAIPPDKWQDVRKARQFDGAAKRFSPDLPKPKFKQRGRRISFSRSIADIQIVSKHLFDDPDIDPSEVGALCFDNCLDEAQR